MELPANNFTSHGPELKNAGAKFNTIWRTFDEMQEHWNNIYPTLFQPRLNVQVSPTTPTHGNNCKT